MTTTIRQNNIDFTNIKSDPIFMVNGKFSKSDHNDGNNMFDITLSEFEISKSFNSIEIDWNGAKLPNGDPSNGGQKIINTTGELIKQLDNIQKEIHILTDIIFEFTFNYYWYVGQTNPLDMSNIDYNNLAIDYEHGGGWYELGTSVPESIKQLIKGFDSSQNIYAAVPVTTGTTLKPVASDMTTIDTSVIELTTKVFNNVTYKFYSYGSGSVRKTIMFAKK